MNYKALNSKETKNILALLKKQFDFKEKLDYGFLMNEKERIYIANREIFNMDMSKLRINTIGIYFGEMQDDGIRLSIEGSQIIGPKSKKGILELDNIEIKEWLEGTDIKKETELKGYTLIKNNGDFFGTGKITTKKILNYVPKVRRINTKD